MASAESLQLTEADIAGLDAAIAGAVERLQPSPSPVEFEPPCIVDGLDPAVYHADVNSVGVGGLRLVGRSPLHHWWAHRRPGRETPQPTPSQVTGTAIHAAVLEPERFRSEFAAAPDVDRRFKEGKAAYAEFMEQAAGRNVITAADERAALAIAERIRQSKLGAMFFADSPRTEVSVYWSDRKTGVRCRMRADLVPSTHPVIVDLKSCDDAQESKLRNRAWDQGYAMRAAWYVDGWRAATGEKRDYVFAVWEKEEPYANAWYFAEDEMIEAGRAQYRGLLDTYAACLQSDRWPGYFDGLQPLHLPPWASEMKI